MFDTFFSFLQRSPRQILLGIFVHSKHTRDEWLLPEKHTESVMTSFQSEPTVDCTEFLKVFLLLPSPTHVTHSFRTLSSPSWSAT